MELFRFCLFLRS